MQVPPTQEEAPVQSIPEEVSQEPPSTTHVGIAGGLHVPAVKVAIEPLQVHPLV